MLRFATIGTSWITTQFADAVARVPGVEVAAVYSRDAGRAEAFAGRLGVAAWSDDLEALLASGDVDAVYVASPNATHARAGLRPLCKPAATCWWRSRPRSTAAEFERLAAVANAAGLVLLEGMRTAYDPGTARVRDLLGELGTLRRVSLRYAQRSSRYDQVLAGERVNIFDPAMGGGALNDLGIYCVGALVDLFGEPERVLAATVPVASGADGAGAALAVYPGLVVDVSWSKITASDVPSEVQGERGTLVIDHLPAPRHLEVRLLDGGSELVELAVEPFDLRYEVERFAALCAGTADASRDHRRTLAALRTMDAIRAAAVPAG
ncbi:MAG: Gfo/Idh/MocA family oxidoreductase [Propionicimonas sp.]|uniref:Gfo/Idh/MocA family protein n=1 Tax=Propionicimonas sp. TaxID=1955623 RepID=UPI003D12B727